MGEIEIRPATVHDSPCIARLFLISSAGLAEYVWSRIAEPGEAPESAGIRRYARSGVRYSFENCLLAVAKTAVVGMAHSFPVDFDPHAATETDAVLRPYSDLEDYGSLYISGIAVNEAWRDRGIGRKLIHMTNERAKRIGRLRLSLICYDRNEGAMRFYRRLGFSESARRPVVPHKALQYGDGDAILLVRNVSE